MKKLTKLLAFGILAGILFVSCSKDDDENGDDNNNNIPSGNMMKCTVNGTAWEATLAVVASNNSGIVTCTGSDSNSRQLMFSINNAAGTGTYTLGGSLTNTNMGRWTQGLGQNDTYTTMLGQGSGSVTISEMDNVGFSGTFQFTAKNGAGDEVTIASGEFNAKFQTE